MAEKSSISLQARAYDQLRSDIIFCNLTPGEKISPRTLEERYGFGRTPIRESLVRLSQQGLVHTVPQSGTYISKINMQSAENARFAREQLERPVAIECCTRVSKKDLQTLSDLMDAQATALKAHDHRSFFDLDNQFHATLFDIAGKIEIWRWLMVNDIHLSRFRWLRVQVQNLDWNAILEQHMALYGAIEEHNTDDAGYLVSAHLHLMVAEREAVISAYPDYFEE